MYGLINRAVEQMVTSRFGTETWEAVRTRAGIDAEGFLAMSVYPDEWTYKLVAAASDVLETPSDDILEAFGEYWVLETAQASYGPLLKLSGRSLPDFLQNLDQMHGRLELTFKDMKAPSFECTDVTDRSLVLHYHSSRAGLLPFVVGLVKGLGKLFETPAEVSILNRREAGAGHDTLLVTTGA